MSFLLVHSIRVCQNISNRLGLRDLLLIYRCLLSFKLDATRTGVLRVSRISEIGNHHNRSFLVVFVVDGVGTWFTQKRILRFPVLDRY